MLITLFLLLLKSLETQYQVSRGFFYTSYKKNRKHTSGAPFEVARVNRYFSLLYDVALKFFPLSHNSITLLLRSILFDNATKIIFNLTFVWTIDLNLIINNYSHNIYNIIWTRYIIYLFSKYKVPFESYQLFRHVPTFWLGRYVITAVLYFITKLISRDS